MTAEIKIDFKLQKNPHYKLVQYVRDIFYEITQPRK